MKNSCEEDHFISFKYRELFSYDRNVGAGVMPYRSEQVSKWHGISWKGLLDAQSGILYKMGDRVMRKILYCASTVSHILNFHLPYLQSFHEQGFEIWVAADTQASVPYADRVIALPIQKKFLSFGNLKAILKVRRLIRQQKFDVVSTHTELGSAIVRAGILLIRNRPRVVCTVHGYLFHEVDGLNKWIYLLPEKLCARVTDILIVMNHEDYEIARKHRLYKDKLYYIDGMGIDLTKFWPATPEERTSARKDLDIGEDDFVFVYAAEFSNRKNQAFLIRSFAGISQESPHVKLLLAGTGALLEECKALVHTLGWEDHIYFPGYVKDMRQLYAASDACVSVSRIEGLPFNLMEAMACGLPVVASDIKGHRELTRNGESGLLFRNAAELEDRMKRVWQENELRKTLREKGLQQVKKFALSTVFPDVMERYREVL